MPAANYNAAVLANGAAGENVMLLTARWDETTPAPACGQFYMLRAWEAEEAPLLSRPISVHRFDREKKEISFLYEVRGTGTQKLAALRPGDTVALTGPSGRGFPVDGTLGGAVALVGGGIGTAPLLQLAAELAAWTWTFTRAFGTSRIVLTRSALRAVRYTSPRIPAATATTAL